MAEPDGLEAAFSEYAVEKWTQSEWHAFGRGTGTTDLLDDHPRLFRSLSFGDDDYGACVWDIVPTVLREAVGPSVQERMTLVAEFVPDLVEWIRTNGKHRTRKRFLATLSQAREQLPAEWESDASAWLVMPNPLAKQPETPVPPVVSETPIDWANWDLPSPSPAPEKKLLNLSTRITLPTPDPPEVPAIESPNQIFVVHGRDLSTVNDLKVKVHSITGIMPQILADQPGQGNTIIEKFEHHANASHYAIVLLTPDDEGRLAGQGSLQPRARQNVILELGYFFGKLGRKRVVVINKGVEQPSDVHGLNYIEYGTPTWLEELRRELKAAGFVIHS